MLSLAGEKKATFLAAGTDKGYVKAWEVSRKEPRQHAAPRRVRRVSPSDGVSPRT